MKCVSWRGAVSLPRTGRRKHGLRLSICFVFLRREQEILIGGRKQGLRILTIVNSKSVNIASYNYNVQFCKL